MNKSRPISIGCFSIVVMLVLGVSIPVQFSDARSYRGSVAQSFINECDESTCSNAGPISSSDGSAIALPIVQSGRGEQGPGPQVPPESDNKLQTRTVDGNRVSVPPNGNPTIATAQCGPGEVATGGGIIVDEANNVINPHFQELGTPGSNPNTWVVSYTNFGPNVMHIQAEVICAQLVSVP